MKDIITSRSMNTALSTVRRGHELTPNDLGINFTTYPRLSGKDEERFFSERLNSLSLFWNTILRYPSIADITPFQVGEKGCHVVYFRKQFMGVTPIPFRSFTQTFIDSNDAFERRIFSDCEQLLINAFGEAKDFLPRGMALQPGFYISGFDRTMREGASFGIEVSHEMMEDLIREVSKFYCRKGGGRAIVELYQWTKSLFVHEQVHDCRVHEEGDIKDSVQSEIATSAVAFLSTWDYNPIYVARLKRSLFLEDGSTDIYYRAEAAALRVLYSHLKELAKSGRFEKPEHYNVIAIQRCIESTPEPIRNNVIRKITRDIITTPGDKLLLLSNKIKSEFLNK